MELLPWHIRCLLNQSPLPLSPFPNLLSPATTAATSDEGKRDETALEVGDIEERGDSRGLLTWWKNLNKRENENSSP